jgi:hypothetical protein
VISTVVEPLEDFYRKSEQTRQAIVKSWLSAATETNKRVVVVNKERARCARALDCLVDMRGRRKEDGFDGEMSIEDAARA